MLVIYSDLQICLGLGYRVKIQLGALYNVYCDDTSVSHTFLSLNRHMNGPHITTQMVVPNCDRSLRDLNLVEAIPSYAKAIGYRFPRLPSILTERRFFNELGKFDAVYLFPGTSRDFVPRIKQKQKTIFLERINCCTAKAKSILDEAYSRLGVKPQHGIDRDAIDREHEDVEACDYVFCPSPEVERSFLEIGVPAEKLISATYGWSPSRFKNRGSRDRVTPPKDGSFVVLFVGYVSVRKGAHFLLEAWAKAGIPGRLVLCGRMEPAIAQNCAHLLSRSDVIWREYDPNIASAYEAADLFAFPSLEEGGPMVTYEAMAHGLPVLVSPMGAGAIVRDGVDGSIIAPSDVSAMIDKLRKFAGDAELRRAFGEGARQQASHFTWEKVATRRSKEILDRLCPRPDRDS